MAKNLLDPRNPKLPTTPELWGAGAIKYNIKVSDHLPIQDYDSGSKLTERSWYNLKCIWIFDPQHQPNHESVFGDAESAANVEKMRRDSRNRIRSMPWYHSFKVDEADPTKWLAMGMWKFSLDLVKKRMQTEQSEIGESPDINDLPETNELSEIEQPEMEELPEDAGSRLLNTIPESMSADQLQTAPVNLVKLSQDMRRLGFHDKSEDSQPGVEIIRRASQATQCGVLNPGIPNNRVPCELLINLSLISFLQGLTMYDRDVFGKVNWTPISKSFHLRKPEIKDKNKTNILTAMTDGCLQLAQHNVLDERCHTLAIIEVKPQRRLRKFLFQESAEMACWIASQPESGHLPRASGGLYRYAIYLMENESASTNLHL